MQYGSILGEPILDIKNGCINTEEMTLSTNMCLKIQFQGCWELVSTGCRHRRRKVIPGHSILRNIICFFAICLERNTDIPKSMLKIQGDRFKLSKIEINRPVLKTLNFFMAKNSLVEAKTLFSFVYCRAILVDIQGIQEPAEIIWKVPFVCIFLLAEVGGKSEIPECFMEWVVFQVGLRGKLGL